MTRFTQVLTILTKNTYRVFVKIKSVNKRKYARNNVVYHSDGKFAKLIENLTKFEENASLSMNKK